jgi:2-hydroxychromene-2-carboxylate isomerase
VTPVVENPSAAERPAAVDFHFDIMCPFAFHASRWIREVRELTGLQITWRFFSLEEINRVEGKKHPWEREWSYGWSMLRIAALLRRRDMDLVDRWYARAGDALHLEGRQPHKREIARALLAEIGIDPAVVDEAIADPTTHDDVLADHRRVVDTGGFGVPTMFFPDGQCLFGPVFVNPPTGDRGRARRLPRRARLGQHQPRRDHRVRAARPSEHLRRGPPPCRRLTARIPGSTPTPSTPRSTSTCWTPRVRPC